MEAKTSTIVLETRGADGGVEVDAYFNVVQYTVDGPWLVMTHADGVVTMIQPDPAHAVVVRPDTD